MSSKRLPSFNELTSTFSNSLQIDSSNDQNFTGSNVTSAQQRPQTSQSQQMTNILSQQVGHAPFHLVPGRPMPGPPQQHQLPNFIPAVNQQKQQLPQQQQYPPPNQHIIYQRVPPSHPELTRFQFPPSDANYVVSPSSNGTPSSVVTHQQQNSSSFDHERRLSMQIPPYPSHHFKKDSYDSQTSLSTLADIASENNKPNHSQQEMQQQKQLQYDAITVIHSIERALEKFRSLSQIFNDVNYDFLIQCENSLKQGSGVSDENIRLLFDYTSSTGEAMNNISIVFLEKFITNIPITALKASVQMSDEIRTILESWLIYREREATRSVRTQEGGRTTPHSRSCTPVVPSTSTFARSHSRQNSRGKFTRQHHHNRHQSISGPHPTLLATKKTFESSEPLNKKRKSSIATKFSSISSSNSSGSNNNNKNDKISLIVKPPKPVTDPSVTQPPPAKGVFNEDLSIKLDHKCQQCGSDDTPEWRRGPYGSRSLCNACGLFYGKLIKKFGFDEAAKIMMKRKNQGHGDDRRIPID